MPTVAAATAGAGPACFAFFPHGAGNAPAVQSTTTHPVIRTRLVLAILLTFTISQPSTQPSTCHPDPSLLHGRLGRGGQLFDHFAEPLDSSRIVDLLPERDGGRGNADHLAVEDLVAYANE